MARVRGVSIPRDVRIGALAAFGVALALSGAASWRSSQAGRERAGRPSSDVVVPFELANRLMAVPVRINGSRPLSFVLDTGNKYAIVDRQVAETLGLSFGRTVSVTGAGPAASSAWLVDGATVTIDALPGFSEPVKLALSLGQLASHIGHPFEGILGEEFIRQFVVEVDYVKRTLTLHEPSAFVYSGPGVSVPVTFNAGGHPLFGATITPVGGKPLPVTCVLDLGSSGPLTLMAPFVAGQHLPGPNVSTAPKLGGGGTGGRSEGLYGRVQSFTLGGITLDRPMAIFSLDPAGAFATTAVQVNVGQVVASRFRIFLDYGRNRIIFEPTPDVHAPFDWAFAGLYLEAGGDDFRRFEVTEVADGGPAGIAGIRKGDTIVEIDGRSTSTLALGDVIDALTRPVTHALVIERGGATRRVKLTPAILK